jgi:RND family efflux transporter MFP subunit
MAWRGVVIAVLAGLGAAAADRPLGAAEVSQAEGETSGSAVSVIAVEPTVFARTILVTGSLVAREELLVTPQIEGQRIHEILAEEGDRVSEGQVLARLADDTLKAQLAQLEASLVRADASIAQARSRITDAEANKKLAEAAFARVKELMKSGTTSRSVYDEREAAAGTAAAAVTLAQDGLLVAQADRTQIEAQIRESKLRLSFTDIKAPAGGIISRRTAKVGALASAIADPLFRIIAEGEIEVDAEVPEIYLPRIAIGQSASIEVIGLKPRIGKVRLISPEVDPATRLGKVRIFIGEDPSLRVGSFARAIIDTGARQALSVPATAILNRDEGASVKVVKDGRVETRKVSVGLRSNGTAEIIDGLREGELVVARSGMLLRDGDAVRPILSDATTASEAR